MIPPREDSAPEPDTADQREELVLEVLRTLSTSHREVIRDVELHTLFTLIETTLHIAREDLRPRPPAYNAPLDDRVRWAMRQDVVVREIRATRKISAIKELRALTHWGLKESKDVVDEMWDRLGGSPYAYLPST